MIFLVVFVPVSIVIIVLLINFLRLYKARRNVKNTKKKDRNLKNF